MDTHRYATNVTNHIKSAGWGGSEGITHTQLEKFQEFSGYMLLLYLTCCAAALKLNYVLGDHLHDFNIQVKDKLVQNKNASHTTAAIAALFSPVGLAEASAPSSSAMRGTPNVCAQCNSIIHNIKCCFCKVKEKRKRAAALLYSEDPPFIQMSGSS